MRFPLPDRFKVNHVAIFIATLFVVQQLEGTEIVFSLLVAAYLVIFAVAFNVAGGLFYASGAYIFFNGMLTAVIGLSYKAFIGEAGQTVLLTPNKTMACYCGGMACMGLAAFVSAHLRPRHALLAGMAVGGQMKKAAMGCLVVSVLVTLFGYGDIGKTASFSSAFRQLDHFGQMAILLGTTYEINSSGGKRSTNWIVWVTGIYLFAIGLIYFSKEGMFVPITTWFIPCIVLNFNFSKKQLVLGAFTIFFMFHYLVPYSQYARAFRGETRAQNIPYAIHYLSHLEETRKLYLQDNASEDLTGIPHLYAAQHGLFDRLTMLPFDDALVDRTDQGYVYGLLPTYQAFANAIPRVFWPNKPNWKTGNDYGREIGVLGDEDTTTGISFSPIGDAYHQAEWFGVLVVLPIIMFLLFFITDSLAGDIRRSPWGLLPTAVAAHYAPEGLLVGAIYMFTFGSFALIFVALLAKYVLPIASALATGGERTRVRATINFTPAARPRLTPVSKAADPGPIAP